MVKAKVILLVLELLKDLISYLGLILLMKDLGINDLPTFFSIAKKQLLDNLERVYTKNINVSIILTLFKK